MTDQDLLLEARLAAFAAGALLALPEELRKECDTLAALDPGMKIRPSETYPEQVELWWVGRLVGVTTWSWLNTGAAPSQSDPE
jgi:hypothetical protein